MGARIFSTLVLWALTVSAVVFGGTAGWTLIIALLSAGALWETCKILQKTGLKPMLWGAQAANAFIFATAWGLSHFDLFPRASGAIAFAVCAAVIALLCLKDNEGDFAQKTASPTILALMFVPFMLQWLAILGMEARSQESAYTGIVLAIWIVAAAKFSDVGAYVLGAAFGRHKMAKTISPKKTIEGAVGGILSSAAISAIIAWGFAPILPVEFTPITAAVAGGAIGFAAIFSDLLESALKRKAGVKDSGDMIPGIGGALDLADSLLLTAPLGTLFVAAII